MGVYIFISFTLFFIIQFLFAQKIYSRNYFVIAFLFSLLLPLISFLHINREEWMKSFPGLLLVFLFVILLFIVKKVYKKANRFLIGKKLIKKEYDQKDFTYVMWSDAIPDWWNEKLASKPSWFDYLITVLLLILPIWLMIILTKILRIS